jgi:diaminopimelate epimerase
MTMAASSADRIALTKLHGLGNDFLVILDRVDPDAPGDVRGPDAELARRLCHRRLGVGADGLIWGRLLEGSTEAGDGVRLSFRLWNADGSEAEMSGNGMRCLAHAALDEGWIGEEEAVAVITPAGRREVSVKRSGSEPGLTWSTVEMGPVKVGGEESRCNVGHGQLLVDVGNPHLVVLGPDPDTVDVAKLGPRLETSDPAGLNVEFVTLGPGPDTLTMRVWERGVGETEACGTGSVAAAAALHHWKRVGPAVTVQQPGGAAAVELRRDGTATLAGPSRHVATCVVER